MGSPKMLPRKLSVEKSETKIDAIQEETSESAKDDVIVKTKSVMYPPMKNDQDKKLTPDLNELRNARLARFNTSLEIKRNQTEIERQNAIATNRKQSPEKKLSEKLDFSDPIALEREKERLRDKIRAMNAKAFTEKYPTQNGKNENEGKNLQEKNQPSAPLESSKLGAIKKVFKKLPEEVIEKVDEEKIINKDVKVASPKDKREKISISVQTTQDARPRKKSEDFTFVPMTVIDFDKKGKEEIKIETKLLIDESKFSGGNAYNTNTIAINKILRNLENAIADGKHDEAAKFAKDLAKLKVALSVTRQRERPKSDVDLQLSKLK
jgi:RanBP-type and C3HC4-type zinc finger-containing protein 1